MKILKNIRKQLGLSQYELAVFLNIPRSMLAMAEMGVRNLDTATMIKIAQVVAFLHANKNNTPSASLLPAAGGQMILSREKLLLQKRNNLTRISLLVYTIQGLQEKLSKFQLLRQLVAYLEETGIDPKNLSTITISKTIHLELMKAEQELMLLHANNDFIESSLEKLPI